MKRLNRVVLLTIFALSMSIGGAAAQTATDVSALRDKALATMSKVPTSLPEDLGPPGTAAQVELGKFLYFDPRLSLSNQISCNSCHNLATGGVDNQVVSVGHKWALDDRNAPTTLNAVFNLAQFWDGHSPDLVAQAHDPITDPKEMAFSENDVVATVSSIPLYREMVHSAFPDANDQVTMTLVQEAIAFFEMTLLTPHSPFDRFLSGDDEALGQEALDGLALFIDKGCTTCHDGVGIGGTKFRKFGVVADPGVRFRPPDDLGRFAVTGDEADKYVYKVPLLRNIALTAPYFHTGSTWSLEEAVKVMGRAQLGLQLSDDEASKIVAFLNTLTGDQPDILLPALPPSTQNTPRPQP
ncbi:MAG: cytochrome-c peroxidase [Devosia sp.]